MIVEVDTVVVTKRAETAAEAERLRHEAAVLDASRHPGVVELLGAEGDALRLRTVAGRPLSQWRDISEAQALGVAAAVATTLADLHDIGIAHGAVSADHILVADEPGAPPVLCSFGRGGDGPDPADDVAGLAAILRRLLGDRGGPALRRFLARATHPDPRRRPGARRLAAALGPLAAGDEPAADVRGTALGKVPTPALDRRRRSAAAVAAAGAAAVAGLALLAWLDRPHSGARRYQIGQPRDQVVTGRWGCHEPRAALLRPATGEVWVFDAWASPGHQVTAYLAARVTGAISVQVADAAGCDRLVVTRRDGSRVDVDPNVRNVAA